MQENIYESSKNYGIIGNLHTTALVSNKGSIDWLCLPDLDSGSVFAKILDKDKGGFFEICPVEDFKGEQKYIEKTNILETRFIFQDNRKVIITDFMPPKNQIKKDDSTILIRKVECIKGTVLVRITFNPRTDYGKHNPEYKKEESMLTAQDSNSTLALRSDIDMHHTDNIYTEELVLKEGNV
ncbi:MAG: DUF5911 domain-containing protein, partial [Bacteroidota bacterium]|nr:DUF5911 domain-containing protein [Bacteroidota bacterium]